MIHIYGFDYTKPLPRHAEGRRSKPYNRKSDGHRRDEAGYGEQTEYKTRENDSQKRTNRVYEENQ
jgi:hypothetical protein